MSLHLKCSILAAVIKRDWCNKTYCKNREFIFSGLLTLMPEGKIHSQKMRLILYHSWKKMEPTDSWQWGKSLPRLTSSKPSDIYFPPNMLKSSFALNSYQNSRKNNTLFNVGPHTYAITSGQLVLLTEKSLRSNHKVMLMCKKQRSWQIKKHCFFQPKPQCTSSK